MKRVKNKYFNRAIAFCLLLFGYLYLTPYASIFLFKQAIETNNSSKFNKFIDFYSFRNSLKPQIYNAFQNKLSSEFKNTPFSAIGLTIANPILNKTVDTIVDKTITPNGLKLLLTSGKLFNSEGEKFNLKKNTESKQINKIKLYYGGINSFVVSSQIMEAYIPIKIYWSREGIYNWKMTSVYIPPEMFN